MLYSFFNPLKSNVAIISYKNQSIDLQSKSIDWSLHDDNFEICTLISYEDFIKCFEKLKSGMKNNGT